MLNAYMDCDPSDLLVYKDILLNRDEVPWEFCVGYHFRDFEKGDPGTESRPIWADPEEEENPSWYPEPSIQSRDDHLINQPSLLTRTLENCEFDRETGKDLIHAAFRQGGQSLQMACYTPHHAIVFYDSNRQPVALLEICFSCYQTTCLLKKGQKILRPVLPTPDFIRLAEIFVSKGIQLHGSADFLEFKKSTEDFTAQIEEHFKRKQQSSIE